MLQFERADNEVCQSTFQPRTWIFFEGREVELDENIMCAYNMEVGRNWGSVSENIHSDSRKLKKCQLKSIGSWLYPKTVDEIIMWAYKMKIRRKWGNVSENIQNDSKKFKKCQLKPIGSSLSFQKSFSGDWNPRFKLKLVNIWGKALNVQIELNNFI